MQALTEILIINLVLKATILYELQLYLTRESNFGFQGWEPAGIPEKSDKQNG
jgi:hypothetical protein